MSKTAVFVEGQSELIFVRDMLLKHFEYDTHEVGVRCLRLISESLQDVPYTYGSEESNHYYMVLNVGNDERVLSAILKRAEGLLHRNYDRIIGLRDIYSKRYRDMCEGQKIDKVIIQQIVDGTQSMINSKMLGDKISFCFSIMEFEAWYLGMPQCLERKDSKLTKNFIAESIGVDLNADPQQTIYHPAKTLDDILKLAGYSYEKKESDVEALNAPLDKNDYANLMASGHCASFAKFYNALVGNSID